jgi:hypothetical protein
MSCVRYWLYTYTLTTSEWSKQTKRQVQVWIKLSLCMPLRHTERGGIVPLIYNLGTRQRWPISVAASLNPARDMNVCLCECCVVRQRSLCRAGHSSRRVVRSVVCLSIIVDLDNEEALAHYGLMCRGGARGENGQRSVVHFISQALYYHRKSPGTKWIKHTRPPHNLSST